MGLVFEVIDKSNRKIHLSRERLSHILEHKGMENHLEDIKNTLINPIKIIAHDDGGLYDYYAFYKHKKSNFKFIKVVVKYLNIFKWRRVCYNSIFCAKYNSLKMEKQLRIYYDEEGDFLQIMFREPRKDYGEHINKDVVFFMDSETNEIIGIGIFNFRKHSKDFRDIIVNLPIKVSLENI